MDGDLKKILYGKTLTEHILVNLIAKPLFKACKNKPSIVLTDQALILGLRPQIQHPLILLTKTQEGQDASSNNVSHFLKSRERRLKPVLIMSHPKYEVDIGDVVGVLSEIFDTYDILEPFERIKNALKAVKKEESKDKR